MLFYCQTIIPGKPQRSIPINLNPSDLVGKISETLGKKFGGLKVKRILFAGQSLRDEEPLSNYSIHKECTVQVMASIPAQTQVEEKKYEETLPIPSQPPSMLRQVTEEELAYGDVLIINVVGASDLKAMDYWSGKSDPYCIVEVKGKKRSCRTSVVQKNLNPMWNETFGFVIDSPGVASPLHPTLTIMCWDHDYLSPDDFLGDIEIDLSRIPRETDVKLLKENKQIIEQNKLLIGERWFELQNTEKGKIRILFRRAAITSSKMREVLMNLENHPSCWTKSLLDKHGVTLAQLVGEEPWVVGRKTDRKEDVEMDLSLNPAISQLDQVIKRGSLKLINTRTLAKVANILWTQNGVFTKDIPTRYLWFVNVTIKPKEFHKLLQKISLGGLKSLLFYENKGRDQKFCGSAIATFKKCEDAVLILIALQNRVLKHLQNIEEELDGYAIISNPKDGEDKDDRESIPMHIGFSCQPKWNEETGKYETIFDGSIKTGVVSIAGPYNTSRNFEEKRKEEGQDHLSTEWGKYLVILKSNGVLDAYMRAQDFERDGPLFSMNFSDNSALHLTIGPWSLELLDTKKKISYYLKAFSSDILAMWKEMFRYVKKNAKEEEIEIKEISEKIEDSKLDDFTELCSKCGNSKEMSEFYVLDREDGRVSPKICTDCWNAEIQELMKKLKDHEAGAGNAASDILNKFSLQDLKDLRSGDQFNNFLDHCTQEFLKERRNQFLKCPKCSFTFEVAYHTWATKQPNVSKELGLDNRPLSTEAQNHFLSNRFLCGNDPKCKASFCRLCNATPYHLGFVCKEYEEYLNSPKCRFCGVAVMRRNKMKKYISDALVNVCDQEECGKKALKCCKISHSCTHPCIGVLDEKDHVNCLKPECREKQEKELELNLKEIEKKGEEQKITDSQDFKDDVDETKSELIAVKHDEDDLCGICYVEELSKSPCVKLNCGHIFHFECVKSRIEAKWPGNRIGFKFAHCPICNKWMDNDALDDIIKPIAELRDKVLDKIEARVSLEEADDDPDFKSRVLIDPTDRFYKRPILWGLKTYAFYKCNQCSMPYFGGKRNCEDNAGDEKANQDEFVCFDCASGAGAGNCGKAGHNEYLLWKCRFCCCPAVWFCFGTTHFCDYCHSHWPPNRNCPKCKMKCPGDDGKCPGGLPLGKHKSNIDTNEAEYCIGCGMCKNETRGANFDKKEKEALEKLKKLELNKEKYKLERLEMYPPRRKKKNAIEIKKVNEKKDVPEVNLFQDLGAKLRERIEQVKHKGKQLLFDKKPAKKKKGGNNNLRGDLLAEIRRKRHEEKKEVILPVKNEVAEIGKMVDELFNAAAIPRDGVIPMAPPVPQQPNPINLPNVPDAAGQWECGICTFLNHEAVQWCEVCDNPRKKA